MQSVPVNQERDALWYQHSGHQALASTQRTLVQSVQPLIANSGAVATEFSSCVSAGDRKSVV